MSLVNVNGIGVAVLSIAMVIDAVGMSVYTLIIMHFWLVGGFVCGVFYVQRFVISVEALLTGYMRLVAHT